MNREIELLGMGILVAWGIGSCLLSLVIFWACRAIWRHLSDWQLF